MGQPHHHNFFCGFTVEELLEWLVAYRQIRRSLTKDKILSDVDNLLQLVHDFYNARLYPLQVTFLTAATLYFQSGDSIINPSMLTKYPLDRERYESYWNAFCLQKPEDIKREDIQACLFGGRPVGDPDPNANREEVWDGYESDKNSDFELGRSKSMKLKKVEELSKLEYALRIQGGEHLDASRSHAVPRYDLSRHAKLMGKPTTPMRASASQDRRWTSRKPLVTYAPMPRTRVLLLLGLFVLIPRED